MSETMVEKINKVLEEIGSNFRTFNGYSVWMFLGDSTFIKKDFDTQEECLAYVESRRKYARSPQKQGS